MEGGDEKEGSVVEVRYFKSLLNSVWEFNSLSGKLMKVNTLIFKKNSRRNRSGWYTQSSLLTLFIFLKNVVRRDQLPVLSDGSVQAVQSVGPCEARASEHRHGRLFGRNVPVQLAPERGGDGSVGSSARANASPGSWTAQLRRSQCRLLQYPVSQGIDFEYNPQSERSFCCLLLSGYPGLYVLLIRYLYYFIASLLYLQMIVKKVSR